MHEGITNSHFAYWYVWSVGRSVGHERPRLAYPHPNSVADAKAYWADLLGLTEVAAPASLADPSVTVAFSNGPDKGQAVALQFVQPSDGAPGKLFLVTSVIMGVVVGRRSPTASPPHCPTTTAPTPRPPPHRRSRPRARVWPRMFCVRLRAPDLSDGEGRR